MCCVGWRSEFTPAEFAAASLLPNPSRSVSVNLSKSVIILNWKALGLRFLIQALDSDIVDVILGASSVNHFIKIEGHTSHSGYNGKSQNGVLLPHCHQVLPHAV